MACSANTEVMFEVKAVTCKLKFGLYGGRKKQVHGNDLVTEACIDQTTTSNKTFLFAQPRIAFFSSSGVTLIWQTLLYHTN